MNPVAIRLLNQQLIAPQFSTPTEVVSYMGAMQAQEYRMMRWAVAMRTKSPSHLLFSKAYDSGEIVRLHLLRGTWQLISGEDYAWMLKLCAPKAATVINGWMKAGGISIEDRERLEIRDILERTAADRGSVTKEDFVEALAMRDISMAEHRLSYHIRMAELDGVLCSGDLHPQKATYSLAVNKISHRLTMSEEEALARLARKYFQSRSPATLEDFAWWSALSLTECRKAVAMLGDELSEEHWNGRRFYIHRACRTRGYRAGKSILLAPYDEYLISYKSRDVVLPAEHTHRAHSNNGIFYPVILRDGVIYGNWKPYSKRLQTTFFEAERNDESPLENEWAAYQRFLAR